MLPSYSQDNNDTLNYLLNKAYNKISEEPGRAIELFEQVLEFDSENIQVYKQLGYLYISQNQKEEALQKFRIVERLAPSDTVKLQIAYLLNDLNNSREAYYYFKQIECSNDIDIREKAQTAVIILKLELDKQKYPWWGKIYVTPYYDTRWSSYFGLLRLQEGYYFDSKKIFSLYGSVRITGDSKSKKGTERRAPILFSDNAIILGTGIRINPFYGFYTEIQGGIGIDIIERTSSSRIKEDFRVVAGYGNGIYPSLSTPYSLRFSLKPFMDFYGTFGYYSRYKNSIGYGSTRAGLRLIEWKKSAIDLYGRFDIARDTERKFYNNLVEWGGGIQFIPHYSFGLIFVAEYHRGRYWKVTDFVLPYDLYYNSYRFFIIFERAL